MEGYDHYKIIPVADFFEIKTSTFAVPVRVPYLVVFADDKESAERAAQILAPTQKIKTIYIWNN